MSNGIVSSISLIWVKSVILSYVDSENEMYFQYSNSIFSMKYVVIRFLGKIIL